jgi:predicted transcriptional regulator of viral defense system
MQSISGLGKVDRKQLSAVIRGTKGAVSVGETAMILDVSRVAAAKKLARWASKGWLSRVRRGLYVSVPLESRTSDIALEDPWLIADRLYALCYIGGWSAAEYWDLTEQIFRTIVVMTTRKPRDRSPVIKGTSFMLRTVQEKAMFGLKPVWCGQVKVSVSNPSRTILDVLNDPLLGGGLRSTTDFLINYLKSDNRDLDLLIDYANRLGNGAVFKRMGFLLERLVPEEQEVIDACRERMTTGNAKLDPTLASDKLVTRWRLWVPEGWAKEKTVD